MEIEDFGKKVKDLCHEAIENGCSMSEVSGNLQANIFLLNMEFIIRAKK